MIKERKGLETCFSGSTGDFVPWPISAKLLIKKQQLHNQHGLNHTVGERPALHGAAPVA